LEVSISSRRTVVTPRLAKAVRTKIGKLGRLVPELDSAVVHFETQRNPRITDRETCEVTVSGHGHRLRSKVSAPDPFTAVDLVEAKLEHRVRKLRTRLQLRRHGRGDTIRGRGTAESGSARAAAWGSDGAPGFSGPARADSADAASASD